MKQLTKWLVNAVLINVVFLSATFASDNTGIQIDYQSADGAYVLFWDCSDRSPAPDATLYINVTSVTGGSGTYNIIPAANTYVSQNRISEGEGFTFYFTEAAQNAVNVSFKITDTQGRSCDIDFYIETQLYYLDVGNCDGSGVSCKENIKHYDGMVPVTDHAAVDTILSTGIIQATTDINYFAGTVIDLQSGFEVKTNADFLATIQDCQP